MINAIRTIMIKAGELPTKDPRGTWVIINSFMEQEHRPQCQPESKCYVLWALVPAEASTANPSEADIAERVRLLRKACTVIAHPSDVSGLGRYNYHFACLEGGPYYLQNRNLVWSAASPEEFAAEIERVAIRQLLAERGAK